MAFSGGKLKQDCPSQSLYKVSDEEDWIKHLICIHIKVLNGMKYKVWEIKKYIGGESGPENKNKSRPTCAFSSYFAHSWQKFNCKKVDRHSPTLVILNVLMCCIVVLTKPSHPWEAIIINESLCKVIPPSSSYQNCHSSFERVVFYILSSWELLVLPKKNKD